ncbi:hypothetical protein Rctr71_066 [Virus Rctr71]|nr:hypothetical protein Rctr71_066 [Virus Rctr71]
MSGDYVPKNAPELTKWFLVEAKIPWDEDTFRLHLQRVTALVGSSKKKGRWTPSQVQKGVRKYYDAFGKYPSQVGELSRLHNGKHFLAWANTPPEPPDITDTPSLLSYAQEWWGQLSDSTKEVIGYALDSYQGAGGIGLAELGIDRRHR